MYLFYLADHGHSACIASLLSIYYRVIATRSKDLTWDVLAIELLA
jgi:hypothetical protein